MDFYHTLVLSLIQGLTEFLPVSSSGHLILLPKLTGWQDQGHIIDVCAHVGTLGAVLVYFYRDVWAMVQGLYKGALGRPNGATYLALTLVVATIPAVLFGLLISMMGGTPRSEIMVAINAILFGLLLFYADRVGKQEKTLKDVTYGSAILMGLGQMVALIPGVSRSGAVLTTARILGFTRAEAARYAFLMAIPAILGAGTLTGYKLYKEGGLVLDASCQLTIAFSFLFGLMAIHFMMWWLRRTTMTAFVVYRLVLGAVLLAHSLWVFL